MAKEYRMLKRLILILASIGSIVVVYVAFIHFPPPSPARIPLIILGHVEYNEIPIYLGVAPNIDQFELKELAYAFEGESIKVKLGYTDFVVKEFSGLSIKAGDKYTIEILENDEAKITH